YALGTALCALAVNIWQLVCFRLIASLGIGGEWAIGATLIAESVPESRRVESGVIMYTSSPVGIALASVLNYLIAGVWFAGEPETSWRYVFLAGLAPVLVALLVRLFLHESEGWQQPSGAAQQPRPRELFQPAMRRGAAGMVGLQCIHSAAGRHACNRARRPRRSARAADGSARRSVEGACVESLQRRRPDRCARGDSARALHGPPPHARRVLRVLCCRPRNHLRAEPGAGHPARA